MDPKTQARLLATQNALEQERLNRERRERKLETSSRIASDTAAAAAARQVPAASRLTRA